MKTLNINWGRLPEEVYARIKKLEWDQQQHLKDRLTDKRKFPIKISLLPPTDNQVMKNPTHFRTFIETWTQFSQQQWLTWQSKKYQTFGSQRIPILLTLKSPSELFKYLGPKIEQKMINLEKIIKTFTNYDSRLYPVLIQHLPLVEQLSSQQTNNLISILKQLSAGMGKNSYLRSLPLQEVDTKFLENNKVLISALLDVLHNENVTKVGGLIKWLGCLDNPKGWLFIKPLCRKTQTALANLPILQMDQHTLLEYNLPAQNILVIENIQSGLALPSLPDCIAVFGGGNNVNWLEAKWLKSKKIAYWGDIDSWGFKILSQAKMLCPHIQTLMMDKETLTRYHQSMSIEPKPYSDIPSNLSSDEKELLTLLQSGKFNANRLEQERLPNDYIITKLQQWLV